MSKTLPHPDSSMAAWLAVDLFAGKTPDAIREQAKPYGVDADRYGYRLVYEAAVIALGPDSPEGQAAAKANRPIIDHPPAPSKDEAIAAFVAAQGRIIVQNDGWKAQAVRLDTAPHGCEFAMAIAVDSPAGTRSFWPRAADGSVSPICVELFDRCAAPVKVSLFPESQLWSSLHAAMAAAGWGSTFTYSAREVPSAVAQ